MLLSKSLYDGLFSSTMVKPIRTIIHARFELILCALYTMVDAQCYYSYMI